MTGEREIPSAGDPDGGTGERQDDFLRWALRAGILLAALGVFMLWAGVKYQRGFSFLGFRPKAAAPAGDTLDVFRRMSFLPQAKRVAAPPFRLPGLDGESHTLQRHAGKVLLVNFWATWCPPCLREMPSMQRLFEKYRAKGLGLLAISVDQDNLKGVRKFLTDLKLTFPILLDPKNETKASYKVRALPTSYLIDRKGRVIAWGMGSREWDGEAANGLIEHLLAEKG